MHGSHGLPTSSNQQRKAPEYGSSLKRSSERSNAVKAPANFVFLGCQQQLIMSQHPGLSHCFSRQQQGFKDMQLWQQHLLYKQLQEIQRQQHIQQLDQGGSPQNLHTQPSGAARLAVVNQFPGVLNGMPVSEASNYMWSNGHAEGELKTPSSSYMLLGGSMNMAPHSGSPMHGISNGLMSSHGQSQLMQPLGFVPQLDQSLNGTPVFHCRDSLTYFSQFQGTSHDCTDAMTKAGVNQTEKPSVPSSASSCFQSDHFMVPEQGCLQDSFLVGKQGLKGNVSFAVAPVQGPNSSATSGNYHQADNFSCSLQAQDFHGRQEENDWSGNLQEKAVMQVKPSHIGTSLDRTEEKHLFGTEDDGNWDASFGSSVTNSTSFLHGNPLESNDHVHAVPSIQNGSWCALMQEALEASSSDTGLHEEWSGLSFQKAELLSGNKSAVSSDNGKQQMMWDDNNLQSASSMTSIPFPLFNDADASSNCHTTPAFEHPIKFAYELNESVSADASHESIQQPSKEASNEHLDQSHQKKQFVGANFQAQTPLNNVSNGVRERRMYEQSVNSAQPIGMELNLRNIQILAHQQKMLFSNVNSQHSNKPDGWNANGSLTPDTLKVHDNDATNQDAQRYETNRLFHMDKNCDNSTVPFPNFPGVLQPVRSDMSGPRMSNADACMGDYAAITTSSTLKFNQEINQQVVNRHQVYYGKHVAVDSSVKYEGDENFTNYQNELSSQHAWDSSLNSTDQGSAEMYNHKQENSPPREVNEGYVFSQSQPTQHTDPGGGARVESLLVGNDHHSLVIYGQNSSGQSGQKTLGPCRFQYHPMGNLEMIMETDSQIQRSYSRGSSHLVVQGSKNQEQVGHVIGYDAVHIGKGHLIDMQMSAKGVEEIQYKGSIPGHDSAMSPFDASAACFSGNRSDGQASQNMLNLLHKVDQSRERIIVSRFSDSKHSALPEIPESAASDGSSHLGFSPQGVFSTMPHNVWATMSSQQCLSGAEPQRALPSINQFTSPLPCMTVATQITVGDGNRRGENSPYGFGASSIDSHEFTYGGEHPIKTDSSQQKPPDKVDAGAKKGSASGWQEPVPKHISDGNSPISIPSLVRLHQQGLNRVKYGQDSNLASLNHDKGASRQTLTSLDAHTQNYSLLQQAMNGTESDPSKRPGKRLKGADLGCNALQMEGTGRRFFFGQKPVLNELDASFQHSSFPSDVKMLSFSSKEDKSASTCSEVTGRDLPSQDLLASRLHDIQNHSHSQIKSSKSMSVGGNEQPQISPQMAPSWFGQYGTCKNGQIRAMYDGLGNSQRTAKGVTCCSAKVSGNMYNGAVVEQRTNVSRVGILQQNTSSIAIAASEGSPSQFLPLGAIDNNTILIPKKRKSATSELLPWYKEVIQGSGRLQTISMAELDWAQAANRLIEKVEDEVKIVEDGPSITRLQKRLVLTTKLMQQLIPSVPAMFLSADATASYGSLMYFVAKLLLGDACSLISCLANDSHMLLNDRKMRPEELKSAEKAGDSFFLKVMENFIGRLGKLESNLLRLEKRSSILDLRVECQDLEKCSIINRFAKFHGRAQTDGVKILSTSENAPHRAFHQRHVTAFAMSGNFPEGVLCFSL